MISKLISFTDLKIQIRSSKSQEAAVLVTSKMIYENSKCQAFQKRIFILVYPSKTMSNNLNHYIIKTHIRKARFIAHLS